MDNTKLPLELLRDKLLVLHKTLIDLERRSYEIKNGKINSHQFLGLLITDKQFSWLRKISELIVWIDEVLDPKVLTAEEEMRNVFTQARKLLSPADLGAEFEQKYKDALQQHPDVIIAHKELRDALKLLP